MLVVGFDCSGAGAGGGEGKVYVRVCGEEVGMGIDYM